MRGWERLFEMDWEDFVFFVMITRYPIICIYKVVGGWDYLTDLRPAET